MKKIIALCFIVLTLGPSTASVVAGPSDGADLRAASWNCSPCPRF